MAARNDATTSAGGHQAPRAQRAAMATAARDRVRLREKRHLIESMDRVLALSQECTAPYTISLFGREFVVLPQVFSPAYYAETAFFTACVVELLNPCDEYLDLGCGAGVTAVMAALKGAAVTALDINHHAITNTLLNATKHGVEHLISAKWSDVYSALEPEDGFDAIYWNVPFGFRDEDTRLTIMEEAIYDPGYRKNRVFVLQARQHLKDGGQLLMGVSSSLGHTEAIEAFAREAGIKFRQIAELQDPDAPFELRMQLWQAKL